LPTDVWYPSTKNVKPEQSDQVAAGWSYEIMKGLLLNNEYYYKRMHNQIDFIDHARLFANDNLEEEFAFGDGYAYGMELGVEKTLGKVTGWVGYTLAFVRRGNFERIMDGRYFAPRYDRRHDLSVVLIYEINRRLAITGTFIYGSGDLTWLPSGRTIFQDVSGNPISPILPIYGDRNTFRMPAYHRMDMSLVIRFFPRWGENDLTLSVYNLYDRRNPYFLYLEPQYDQNFGPDGPPPGAIPVRIAPKQVSLFPILPSLTWNFKF
jgi:outer membrane receptor protein involved in Fe transport